MMKKTMNNKTLIVAGLLCLLTLKGFAQQKEFPVSINLSVGEKM